MAENTSANSDTKMNPSSQKNQGTAPEQKTGRKDSEKKNNDAPSPDRAKLQNDRPQIVQSLDSMSDALASAKRGLEAATDSFHEIVDHVNRGLDQRTRAEQENASLKKDYDSLKKDHESLRKDYDDLKKDHENLKQVVESLKQILNSVPPLRTDVTPAADQSVEQREDDEDLASAPSWNSDDDLASAPSWDSDGENYASGRRQRAADIEIHDAEVANDEKLDQDLSSTIAQPPRPEPGAQPSVAKPARQLQPKRFNLDARPAGETKIVTETRFNGFGASLKDGKSIEEANANSIIGPRRPASRSAAFLWGSRGRPAIRARTPVISGTINVADLVPAGLFPPMPPMPVSTPPDGEPVSADEVPPPGLPPMPPAPLSYAMAVRGRAISAEQRAPAPAPTITVATQSRLPGGDGDDDTNLSDAPSWDSAVDNVDNVK